MPPGLELHARKLLRYRLGHSVWLGAHQINKLRRAITHQHSKNKQQNKQNNQILVWVIVPAFNLWDRCGSPSLGITLRVVFKARQRLYLIWEIPSLVLCRSMLLFWHDSVVLIVDHAIDDLKSNHTYIAVVSYTGIHNYATSLDECFCPFFLANTVPNVYPTDVPKYSLTHLPP